MTKKLLFTVLPADCRIEELASTGGNGGQRKNRRHTAIRITHPPSGAVGFCKEHAHQLQNKLTAWRRMGESKEFQLWARLMSAELASGKTLEEQVEDDMRPENIKVEVRDDNGRWVSES